MRSANFQFPQRKECKMFKINIVEDHGPVNLEPATLKDVLVVAAAALAVAGLMALVLMVVFNLLFFLVPQI
jgi:hypothetical protein